MLRLEGLCRSLLGEVKRTDEDILEAIDQSFARQARNLPKALQQYMDNAIFSLGSDKKKAQ